MANMRLIGSMAFTPSGKGAFTLLLELLSVVNDAFPDGLKAMLSSKTCLILATCLLATFHLTAQPKAFASLQPERIETGDTTGLLILVSGLNSAPKDVDFSPWAAVLPVSNIIGRSDWRRSGTQWTRRFTLIAFDSARLELPPLNVRVASGKPLETNELTLTVFPTRTGREITDMAKIRDIRREPESWLDYWPWAIGVLTGLILLVWRLGKRKAKPEPVVSQITSELPLVSATEMALQKLSQLQQKQLWKNGQTKEHYAELSLILREYLEKHYGIAALESTTDEIQKMLTATDFPIGLRPDLKELLKKTDLVKYAQSQPAEAVHEQVLLKARALIAPGQVKPQERTKTATKTPVPPKAKSGKYEPL